MASGKGKRVLREKDGETLWAEFENGSEGHYADQEEFVWLQEDVHRKFSNWKDILNGIKVYLPSMKEDSINFKAVRWTNSMRADESFTERINLPQPSLFVTDIFEICVDGTSEKKDSTSSFGPNLLYMTDQDIPATIKAANRHGNKKLTVRVQKPFHYDFNTRHYFSAKLRIGSRWISEPSTFKEGEFWFNAEQLSAFFIFASSKLDTFIVEPTGTIHLAHVDERIEIDFEKQTVSTRTPMKLKIWPTNERKVEEVIQRSDEQRITAISDTIFLEHKAPKLHHEVNMKVPLHGISEIQSGENVYLLSYKPDNSDIEYERLKTNQFSILNGNIKIAKAVKSGYGNGIVKTRAKTVRCHEVLELSNQGYLCQFLYFKLPGANEANFHLWVECARKEDVTSIKSKNELQGMIEFPFSCSDDVPIYDQENIQITVRGCVRIRGSKKVGPTRPVNMKFLAVSETTHACIPLVKHQMIDGAYFVDIDISFIRARLRKPIKAQLDPWGRIMHSRAKGEGSLKHRKLSQTSMSKENGWLHFTFSIKSKICYGFYTSHIRRSMKYISKKATGI